MCGIAGIVQFNNTTVQRDNLHKMVSTIKHRGPDEDGIYVSGPVGLCSTRLKILDLSTSGSQPMSSSDGQSVLVYNGELYNYKELKRQFLNNINFNGSSDTEVLLQMYIRFGYDAVKYFNGMFSFVILNKNTNTLFCARDRIGIKPLYYYIDDNYFLFGSEIKSILSMGIKPEPDYRSVYDYLMHGYYEHTEHTFFKNIKSLEPGHYLTLDLNDNKITNKRYWDLARESSKICFSSEENFIEEYESLLCDSIKIRLRSDVPVGINVSGGLDSCLISMGVKKVTQDLEHFPLFCYGGSEKGLNEFEYAEKLGTALGWDTSSFVLKPEQVPQLAEDVMWAEEQPYPGVICMAKHNCFRNLSETNVKVILSGHGGDETAGGYKYFIGAYLLDYISKFGLEKTQNELTKFLKIEKTQDIDIGSFLLNSLHVLFHGQATSDGKTFSFIEGYDKDFLKEHVGHDYKFEKPFSDFSLNMQYQDLRYTKVPRILHNVDRASMSFGIEKRVPILDHRLVELAFSSPIEVRLKNGHQRYFMREIAKKLLPKELVNLPKRHSMDPQRYWFKTTLAGWVEGIINSKSLKERGIFQYKELIKEFNKYKQTEKPATSYHIWQSICLEMWFRMFIDK